MVKVGTRWLSRRTTRKPFESVASSAFGSLTLRISLLTGAFPLISAPTTLCVCCAGAPPRCCAMMGMTANARMTMSADALFLNFVKLLMMVGLLYYCLAAVVAPLGGLGMVMTTVRFVAVKY